MDSGRVALLLAVMEKRAGKKLFDQDVYINVAGGLALSDPAADLAVCVAVASSLMGFALFPYAERHGRGGPLRRGASRGSQAGAPGRGMRAAGIYGDPFAQAEPETPPTHRRAFG